MHRITIGKIWPLAAVVAICHPVTAPAEIQWKNIGPGGGGWLPCVTCSPHDPDTVYVGCDVGGFYKSTDGGNSWTIHNDGLTTDYVRQIVPHPTSPDTLYLAGCGGVFKSTNGGRNWRWLRNGFPEPSAYRYSAPVGALAINPSNPRILYAGIGYPRKQRFGNGLIYRTGDGGHTWTPIHGIADIAPDACFHRIAICPQRPTLIIAATNKGLFRSEDAGSHWHKTAPQLPAQKVTDVTFDPSNSDIVYITLWSPANQKPWCGGVYRSTDAGKSFTTLAANMKHHVGDPGDTHQLTTNFSSVAVSPENPDCIYAGSANWVAAGLFRSLDGGKSWRRVTRKRPNQNIDWGWITMGGQPGIKCLDISPIDPQTAFCGGSMKLFRTHNGGQNWDQCFTKQVKPGWYRTTGLETTCIANITVDPINSDRIYFGYADVGLLVSEDGGNSFQRRVKGIPWHGDMAPIACDPDRPGIVFCGMGKARVPGGGIAKSENYGKSWTVVGSPDTGLPDATTPELVLDPASPKNSRTLYTTSIGNGIYKSTDDGASWRPINNGLPVGKTFTSRRLALSPHDSHTIITAVKHSPRAPTGGLYITQNAGKSWQRLTANTAFPNAHDISIHPADPDVLFVACRRYYDHDNGTNYPGGVYRSDDGGATWQHVLEDRFASNVLISPANPDVVYAGLNDHPYHDNCRGGGIMRSTDGGNTWQTQNSSLTDTQITALVCDPRNPKTLYIGTGGNGAFKGIDHRLPE